MLTSTSPILLPIVTQEHITTTFDTTTALVQAIIGPSHILLPFSIEDILSTPTTLSFHIFYVLHTLAAPHETLATRPVSEERFLHCAFVVMLPAQYIVSDILQLQPRARQDRDWT